MLLNSYLCKCYARPVKLFVILFTFSCFYSACSNRSGDNQVNSADYKKVMDSTTRYFEANQLQKGIDYLESSTRNPNKLSVAQQHQYYDFHVVYNIYHQKDKEKALLYTDSMLTLFKDPEAKQQNMKLFGQTHYVRGDLLFDLGHYNQAYIEYDEGKKAVISILDNCSLAEYSYRMGMVMYKQEQYRLAMRYFKKSHSENENCELDFRVFYRRQELLDNIGLCYHKLNQPDSALHYYNEALKYIDAHGYKFPVKKEFMDMARGVIYGNEAETYTGQGNYDKAEALLKRSIAINIKKGNENTDAQLSEVKLARIYLKKRQPDSLLRLLNSLRTHLDSVPNTGAEADWNYLMASYFNTQGYSDKAINYFLAYDKLKEAVDHKDQAFKETNIAEQIKRFEKEYEVETLKKDNDLQNTYLKIAVLFTAMSLIIILLIWQNFRKSKKNIVTLADLNSKINQQNKHLEDAMNELRKSSQEKDRILRTVAHDLRNPLGGIASLTSVMADENEYTEEQKELLKIIKETSYDSLELINEILEATNTNSTEFTKQWVDINSVLNNSVELLRFKAAEKKQHIDLETLHNSEELMINREKIWRVVSNLISNAIKFSPVGANITVKAVETDKEVLISVNDHGIGIPDNIKNKVFNMFTDAKRPGTLGEKSFGLGLSICRQIIEKHNGNIWFESEPGKGTTFYVSLAKDAKKENLPVSS
jgi:signal transduction histidine kinase